MFARENHLARVIVFCFDFKVFSIDVLLILRNFSLLFLDIILDFFKVMFLILAFKRMVGIIILGLVPLDETLTLLNICFDVMLELILLMVYQVYVALNYFRLLFVFIFEGF